MNTKHFDPETLRQDFLKISQNQLAVDQAVTFITQWLNNPFFSDQHESILAHIEHKKNDLLLDAFYQTLPFGTGGRRGRVGYGPNRINPATVALSVQGHCNYMKNKYDSKDQPIVIVAFDVRIFKDIGRVFSFLPDNHPLINLYSSDLARIACEIYTGNGFTIYTSPEDKPNAFLSTPELSFLIKHYKAIGGINISASHNHPDDNGFKFYNPEAAQDIPPEDEHLDSYMNAESLTVNRMDYQTAKNKGLILDIPDTAHDAYIQTNLEVKNHTVHKSPTIIYTPLCGTGDTNVGDVLRAAGFNVQLYPPHAGYDGTFASIPSRIPNPEVQESALPALPYADEHNAKIVLSSDPDADRIGVFVKNNENKWQYLTGNDIASIIAYYLILDKERGPQRKGLIIKSLVTTRTLEYIAQKGDCHIVSDLLVGFKYIAHVLDSLEKRGSFQNISLSPKDLIIAAEESHGVLLTSKVREKDAAGGALIICELMALLAQENITLPEYLIQLYLSCGNYANNARSIVLKGMYGVEAIANMMASLRKNKPKSLFGRSVEEYVDYLDESVMGPIKSKTDKLSRNLLLFRLNGAQVVIRPSGTEPKLKVYVDIEGDKWSAQNNRQAAIQVAKDLAANVYDKCLERINITLSDSAKLLPDYVEIKQKQDFDESFPSELCDFAKRITQDSVLKNKPENRLNWLKNRLITYASGADPLIAVNAAVSHLSKSIIDSKPGNNIVDGLKMLLSDLIGLEL